jgi:light-regulated signal transduction histidine kinase (bacteriophytochrome)
MQRLIDDLLSYSHLGSTAPVAETVDSRQVVAEVLAALHERIVEVGAEVEVGPLPRVRVERRHLSTLLFHLLGNALGFPAEAPLRIRVEGHHDGRECGFTVRDNGIGIAPRFHQRIFRLFERLQAGSGHQGTGIGLALCKRLVTLYGGRIWVESEPGAGAAFHFTLPAAEKPEGAR